MNELLQWIEEMREHVRADLAWHGDLQQSLRLNEVLAKALKDAHKHPNVADIEIRRAMESAGICL